MEGKDRRSEVLIKGWLLRLIENDVTGGTARPRHNGIDGTKHF